MPKKDINLLPREEFEQKSVGRFLIWALTVGRWIVIVTELIVITAFLSRFKLDRDLANLYEKIRLQQNIVQSFSPFEKDFRTFQDKLIVTNKLITNQLDTNKIISLVSAATPAEVELTSLSYEAGEVKIAGQTLSEIGLKSFVNGLSLSPNFSEIDIISISKQLESNEGTSFRLTAKFKKQEVKK